MCGLQFVMMQVFAAINHQLSEEYSKIDLPTLDTKERYVRFFPLPPLIAYEQLHHSLLTDARYLHEKFTVLKTASAPTALLETLVADKHVATAPVSPRPTTPTPPSPLPLPSSNVPLGGTGRPATTLTKQPLLFSNERIKGMLSRSNTAPPAPAPIPVPAPAPQEKQGGFKQVVVPPSSTPPVNGEPWGSVPKSPNGDAHADVDVGPERHCVDTDADIDAVPQGDEEAAEQPPTPAKDKVLVGSRTSASVPVAVSASEA
jgi:vacuolar protein sorting-associated protein 54